MARTHWIFVALLLGMATTVFAEEAPTFEKLDKELGKYAKRADVEGETHAHMSMDGLPYYCMFDLFLTVMKDPEHPKYAETKKLFDQNMATLKGQAGFVSMILGRDVLTLMCTSSSRYCVDFQKGAEQHAPEFKSDAYAQPLAKTIGEGDEAYKVAWFHALGDADGDGVSNRDELNAIAPNWKPAKNEDGTIKEGTGLGVTDADRDAYVKQALGIDSWRVARESTAASE